MNEKESEILEYLEDSYCGANLAADSSAMVRIARAIAAFKVDPHEMEVDLFTARFIKNYYSV